jgi:outer membrane lipoprotein-sorting protein
MTWALIVATVRKWGALFGLAAAAVVLLVVRLAGIQRGKQQAHLANAKGELNRLEKMEAAQRKTVEAAAAEVEKVKKEQAERAALRRTAARERKQDAETNRSAADVLRRARNAQRRRRTRTRTPPN